MHTPAPDEHPEHGTSSEVLTVSRATWAVRPKDGVLVRETRFGTKLQSGVIVATGRLLGLLRPRTMC